MSTSKWDDPMEVFAALVIGILVFLFMLAIALIAM